MRAGDEQIPPVISGCKVDVLLMVYRAAVSRLLTDCAMAEAS